MSDTAKALIGQFLALPFEERMEVVNTINESVEFNNEPVSTSEDIEAIEADSEWQSELDRRLEIVEKHPDRLLNGQDVIDELRNRFS